MRELFIWRPRGYGWRPSGREHSGHRGVDWLPGDSAYSGSPSLKISCPPAWNDCPCPGWCLPATRSFYAPCMALARSWGGECPTVTTLKGERGTAAGTGTPRGSGAAVATALVESVIMFCRVPRSAASSRSETSLCSHCRRMPWGRGRPDAHRNWFPFLDTQLH